MKNSFFLIIPTQQTNPQRLKRYQPAALKQWLLELPTANPALATRLFHDFINELNGLSMDAQARLDTLELLRPSFITIQAYLRANLVRSGVPKGENEEKIMQFLMAIEKEFTVGYWIVVRELTKKRVGWFQSKVAALSIQRVIRGLSGIVISHNLMYVPVPEWVWMDLHALYKLSVKIKKDAVKVQDGTCRFNKTSSPVDSYKQILLLGLAEAAGLMQSEIIDVYQFCERFTQAIRIVDQPVGKRKPQCLVLQDEDCLPCWLDAQQEKLGSAILYLDTAKLVSALHQKSKYIDESNARFSNIRPDDNFKGKLPVELIEYLKLRWEGQKLVGTPFFADREERLFCIGLNATHALQKVLETDVEGIVEYHAKPVSDRALSCELGQSGMVSIGSLVSFRKTNLPENKRSLGVVCAIAQTRPDNKVRFEIQAIAPQAYAVEYLRLEAAKDAVSQKALIYGVKTQGVEKSYLIIESFALKDFDIIRLFMRDENFPIILRDKKNIGLGCWQFECRRLEEKDVAAASK